jgi:hypothetical protein
VALTAERAPAPSQSRRRDLRFVLIAYGVCAVVFFVVANWSAAHLPASGPVPAHGFPDHRFFNGWTRYDSDWYQSIARRGYYYAGPGQQSSVAFFPGYPAAMRLATVIFRDALISGVVVTYLAGLAAALLFSRFCRAAFGPRAGRVGVLVLLLYPFSLFLFGAVYSDALFLAAALGAFLLLEADRPWLAGWLGAVAVASRPVGLAVALGLVVRALELRGVVPGGPGRLDGRVAGAAAGHRTPFVPWPVKLRAVRARDAGVLVSVLGLAAFCALLWWRFGDPFATFKVVNATGWGRNFDASTLFKRNFFRYFAGGWFGTAQFIVGVNGIATVAALGLLPFVVRRLGWGYGLYAMALLVVPAATSPEFLATGRYALAAFPCFAAGTGLLCPPERPRPRLTAAWLTMSGAAALVMVSAYARWYLL